MSKIIESLRSKGFNADEVVEAIESLEARVAELEEELEDVRVTRIKETQRLKACVAELQRDSHEAMGCNWLEPESTWSSEMWIIYKKVNNYA